MPALGLGGSVVTKLMKPLPENLSFQVTFDNLFTSLNLLQYLGSKDIGATGILWANHSAKCPITNQKEMAKKFLGRMDCMDQNITLYRIPVCVKKWWMPLLMFIPDAAMQNVWLLYRKSDASQSRPLDLFQKRSYRYLPPKILVSASWGSLCWTPNSCFFKKACKST